MEQSTLTHIETSLLYAAIVLYGLCALSWLWPRTSRPTWAPAFIAIKSLALGLHSLALALRWIEQGHGPFINLYEILSSNIWSLNLVLLATFVVWRPLRPALLWAELPLFVMMVWLLFTTPHTSHLPPTYDTIWLYFHVITGKFFLGILLVATSISLTDVHKRFMTLSQPELDGSQLREYAYRFLAIAFVFETAMLLAGAVWAQDAWGRYWAWDPLETWSFITWAFIAVVLHLRSLNITRGVTVSILIPLAFVLAFLTFFGVPFWSTAPHKGMI